MLDLKKLVSKARPKPDDVHLVKKNQKIEKKQKKKQRKEIKRQQKCLRLYESALLNPRYFEQVKAHNVQREVWKANSTKIL